MICNWLAPSGSNTRDPVAWMAGRREIEWPEAHWQSHCEGWWRPQKICQLPAKKPVRFKFWLDSHPWILVWKRRFIDIVFNGLRQSM